MESQVVNNSGLIPVGHAVLIRPLQAERLSNTLVIPDSVRANMQMAEQEAVVVEVGSEAWRDESQARAKAGDRVMVTKYAGIVSPGKDGKEYRLINDRDIFCLVKEVANG